MPQAAKKALGAFEVLPESERSEILAELLRWTAWAPHGLPSDDDLVAAADQLFLGLDRREPGHLSL